jgi:hypothetical protein
MFVIRIAFDCRLDTTNVFCGAVSLLNLLLGTFPVCFDQHGIINVYPETPINGIEIHFIVLGVKSPFDLFYRFVIILMHG